MTATTYTIVPIPRWYFADNAGLPLGGGYMATWSSVNKTLQKPVYTDSTGQFAYPNPVFFNANGEAPGPFFWANDVPYFLQVYDSSNNLMFTMDNYGPAVAGGGGGGGGTTVNNFLENYMVNNNFCRHGGSGSLGDTFTNIQNGTTIAPSNHDGYVSGSTSFATIPYVGPDILFVRSNSSATDSLVFSTTDFSAGQVPLTGDVTPEFYIDVTCSVAGNETLKAVQFPVDLHVKNLEQTTMTAIIWAKNQGGGIKNLLLNFVQFFGTGSATTPVVTAIPIPGSPLSSSWQAYIANFTTPSIAGKALGAGGDDASYLQVCFPTATTFEISFTKPKLYLGNTVTLFPELQTYDYVDRIVNSPRTGDYKISLSSFTPFGWVPANDGSIGTAGSGATTRANIDTWPLYNLLWNNVLDHWAPVATGRGVSAIADFATKAMTLTRTLGRVIAGLNGTAITGQTFTTNYAGNHNNLTVTSSALFTTGTPVQLTNTGGALPTNLAVNTVYFVINVNATTINLATSIENAYASTAIDIGGDQTGTSTVQTALGAYLGETVHTLLSAEMPTHAHNGTVSVTGDSTSSGNNQSIMLQGFNNLTTRTTTLSNMQTAGGSDAHNNMQPTTYMNVFIKL